MRPTLMKTLAAGLLTAAFLFPAPVLAQGPRTVGDILPAGVIYEHSGPHASALPIATVEAWRAVPVLAETSPGPGNLAWVDARGESWRVQYTGGYPIRLDGGGRAELVFGSTRDPGLMFVTVMYESRREELPDGRIAWHCLHAVIVRRGDVGG